MRLLTITHYTALLGANRSLLHLLGSLHGQPDVEVLVFCPGEGAFTQALQKKGIPYEIHPYVNWAHTIRSPKLYLFPWLWWLFRRRHLGNIRERARQFNPDVIHSNSSVVSLGWQLAEALQKPHIWHLREFGWPDYQVVYPLGKALVRQKLAGTDAVVCISEAIRQAWMAALPCPVYIVYNGIGTQAELAKRRALPAAATDGLFNFLIIGQLQASKGQHEAVAAFARMYKQHPQARLIVAGSGQRLYTLRLKWMARRYGISHVVQFTGYVADPAPLYASAQVVLMCSRHEGMGRVTAEAMSYGKPVIGYAGGATPELIRSGENGWLYQNTEELVQYMHRCIQNPADLTRAASGGFETALLFADEVYAGKFREVLKQYAP